MRVRAQHCVTIWRNAACFELNDFFLNKKKAFVEMRMIVQPRSNAYMSLGLYSAERAALRGTVLATSVRISARWKESPRACVVCSCGRSRDGTGRNDGHAGLKRDLVWSDVCAAAHTSVVRSVVVCFFGKEIIPPIRQF